MSRTQHSSTRHVLTATRHVVPTGLSGGIREASLHGLEKCAGVLGRSCETTASCRNVGPFGEPRRDGGPMDRRLIRPSSRPEVASSGGPQDWIGGRSEPYGKVVRRMASTRDFESRMYPLVQPPSVPGAVTITPGTAPPTTSLLNLRRPSICTARTRRAEPFISSVSSGRNVVGHLGERRGVCAPTISSTRSISRPLAWWMRSQGLLNGSPTYQRSTFSPSEPVW